MLNIFNLFLFLFVLWSLFMITAGNISWLYIFFGILASALVSIASFRLKLIEEKSELLHLSFGFYRHFSKIFMTNFFSAIKLVATLGLTNKALHPLIFTVKINSKNTFNPALLMVTFNMSTGLFCIGAKDDEMFIYAINEDFFKKIDLLKICAALNNMNDDNLV